MLAVPAAAQFPNPVPYDVQKVASKAPRIDSLEELRDMGRAYLGKTIELRGQTRGTFSRGTGFAVMLTLTSGQSVILDAPASMRDAVVAKPGATVRVLCKLVNLDGMDGKFTIQNATDQPDPALVKSNDDDNSPVVIAPGNLSPMPGEASILMGPDADLPVATVTGGSALSSRSSTLPRGATSNLTAPSRSRSSSTGNPYYGFGATHRAAYKAMAKRNNPRLRDDMADYIAASILAAAANNNLDPRFLAAVVQVESSFDPYCVSSAGAMGLGQLMPFNLKPLGVANAWDPAQNLNGAAKMLRRNLNTYSNFPNGTLLAVAAYHAGVGAVNRAGYKVPKVSTNRYAWKVYYAYRALAPELFQS